MAPIHVSARLFLLDLSTEQSVSVLRAALAKLADSESDILPSDPQDLSSLSESWAQCLIRLVVVRPVDEVSILDDLKQLDLESVKVGIVLVLVSLLFSVRGL